MTFLPIVDRELRVRARQVKTYRMRSIAVGMALLVAGPMLLWPRGVAPGGSAGQTLFSVLSIMAMILCLFEGVRQTSDCLSEEKREGTLGLLFLTDLKGYDVVLGKLAATSLNSLFTLVAVMPVLGLSLMMGGVTGGEFARVTLVLVDQLFFSLAAGMWVSARSRNEQKAFVGTLLLWSAVGGLPLLDLPLGKELFSLGSPVMAYLLALDTQYRGTPALFWISLFCVHGLSWLLLWRAGRDVQSRWQEEPERAGWWERIWPKPSDRGAANCARLNKKSKEHRRLLDLNPVYWLASRERGPQSRLWALIGMIVLLQCLQMLREFSFQPGAGRSMALAMTFSYINLGVHFALFLLIASIASRCFADARRAGALELLMTTPLSVPEILRGHWMALRRVLFWPVVALLALQGIGYLQYFLRSSNSGGQSAAEWWSHMGVMFVLNAANTVAGGLGRNVAGTHREKARPGSGQNVCLRGVAAVVVLLRRSLLLVSVPFDGLVSRFSPDRRGPSVPAAAEGRAVHPLGPETVAHAIPRTGHRPGAEAARGVAPGAEAGMGREFFAVEVKGP